MNSNWQEMFDKKASTDLGNRGSADTGPEEPQWAPPPDPADYRPWLMQRGGRPAMFIDLRRFEPKTGTMVGCLMSYPALIAVDYVGDRMVSLDFGSRQFIIEGTGLDSLSARLQQGMVLALQEFAPRIWAAHGDSGVITKIASIAFSTDR